MHIIPKLSKPKVGWTGVCHEGEGGPDEFVQDQIAFISNKPLPLKKDKAEKEMYELQKQLDALKMKQLKELSEIESKLTKAKEKCGSTEPKSTSMSEESKGTSKIVEAMLEVEAEKVEVTSSIYKHEFKVAYVALIHQIESGLAKNYSELEIVEAIIKSILTHSSLRNYVLTLLDRSLAKFRKALHVFFQEKLQLNCIKISLTRANSPKNPPNSFYCTCSISTTRLYSPHKRKSHSLNIASNWCKTHFQSHWRWVYVTRGW